MPKVSVIIPTYNSARYLPDALRSVFNQVFKDFEVIIVDDGSTDNTKQVIERYKDKVKYLYKENAGPGSARNLGVRESSGELIAFLDSDDMWEKEKLEAQVFSLQSDLEAALVYCGKLWVDEGGLPLDEQWTQHEYPEGWILGKLFQANHISSSSCVMVKRDALLRIGGFNESPLFRITEDYDLWMKIAARFRCLSIPELLVKYRRHGGNITKHTKQRNVAVLATLNSAVKLIQQNQVDERNYSGVLDISFRLKTAYEQAVVSLFYADEYSTIRSIGWEAIRKGYYSYGLLFRWFLSLMPKEIILWAKRLRKLSQHSKRKS